ncbi:hypothetical protein AB0O32_29295 [Streptomyces rubiginosohelvolus]|uniref:hypothetical protein n=1 Tax=Streptomyces rubiginosohelvolus TaxID=67362 RepID=UPI00341556A3
MGGPCSSVSAELSDQIAADLDGSGNAFVVVQPDGNEPAWSASVTVLEGGGFEVVRRDGTRGEHEVTTATSVNDIAHDLTLWLAARDFPGRPTGRFGAR